MYMSYKLNMEREYENDIAGCDFVTNIVIIAETLV